MRTFMVYADDGREFMVEAYSCDHAERKVLGFCNGRVKIAWSRELR